MNRQKFPRHVTVAFLITLLFVGCNVPASTPTPFLPSIPSSIPSTSTPTSVPPTETTTVVPPTITSTPRPSATPTITPPVGEVTGGAILGLREDEAIVYGLREGAADAEIFILNINDFSEVESQKLILSSLKGEAFAMIVSKNQPFYDDEGNETLVDFIAGWPMETVLSNQNIAVTVARTVNINSAFPLNPASLSGADFAPPGGKPIKIQGWLELYAIQQIDTSLSAEAALGSFNTLLLHSGVQIYLLGFLPNYQYKFPSDDLIDDSLHLNMGKNNEYLVWGFPGKSVSLWLQDKGTVFQAAYIEVTSIIQSVINEQIVFISDRDVYDAIYTMKGDGTNLTSVFSDPNITPAGPVWSPDHSRIAFFNRNEDKSQGDIFIMNADGSGLINLTNNLSFDAAPRWSPDGQKLVYTCEEPQEDNREICVINVDGTGKIRLTHSPLTDGEAHWSPDGSQIAFYSKRDGNLEVYVMNTDGSQQVRLTDNPAEDWLGCWSPDGTKIIFHTNRDGNFEIYSMNWDGTNQINLTNSPGGDWAGNFTRDGQFIIFESDRDGLSQLYIMKSDGSGQIHLLESTSNDLYPDW
jgi:Tol biopolymer transport system component